MSETENPTEAATNDLFGNDDPFALFDQWLSEAHKTEPNDANAMALASVDASGLPNVRMVLLKSADSSGFVFYTNLNSAKGAELAGAPKAALCFHWKSLHRQVRVRGAVEPVSTAQADAYFASRPRGSRIGAWASRQSAPLPSRFALEKAVAKVSAKYGVGAIPRPDHWSGFCLTPSEIEFWRDRPFRLHDRRVFRRSAASAAWTTQRLFP
ncbi:MAG: pyridoxamine 5'-phosphate oxidase [Alphaproteobacteria bacterium]